ncbi:RIC1 -like [Asbolus verrucosus]|uniref:Protein RIC1 homolog n=1 Tax=Asbolus verrucosus TaxID=1661398 RepID=A0A482V986_ASBVE|nr:RIC1 -like [Asbolus verrucosus]
MAIAGRTGLAHYSMHTRRWKLFGNETQEKDFIVVGGLLWWRDYIVMGSYSIIENSDEFRFYPRDSKLDNKFAKIVTVSSPVLLMNILQDQLITFGSDAQVSIWNLKQNHTARDVDVFKVQVIDISALAVHPACIASVTLTSLRTETGRGQQNNSESIVLNVSGRLLLVQREVQNGERYTCSMPTVLASCVENVWVPSRRRADKVCLYLKSDFSAFNGSIMVILRSSWYESLVTFVSKRWRQNTHLHVEKNYVTVSFESISIRKTCNEEMFFLLAILFEDAIILGAENDTVLYTSDSNSPFSLPFSVLQRTSQVYLHQILRQLIRRNLGYHAWEIARSCMSLPYFPHSLELLLHEVGINYFNTLLNNKIIKSKVLEEEATSKEPIPDAQLPSVIEFIMEFPVYLQTVVQCARKTEIALWPYLFSAAGKPKDLFQECMAKRQLDTAASYLIILQNLETSSVSRQYATLLLNTALDQSKWELAKDLVRFLRAIDPNDVESPRTSFILPAKLGLSQQTPPVSPNAEDLSLILGNVQGPRVRSYSTTISPKVVDSRINTNNGVSNNYSVESPQSSRKKSVPSTVGLNKHENRGPQNNTAEEFFIDVILQKHARRLLSTRHLTDLGYFAAHLDFHLVAWLGKERDRAARIDDFIQALKNLHDEFSWPYPTPATFSFQNNTLENSQLNLEDRLKLLKIDVNYQTTSSRVGDSGYMSFQGLPCTGLITPINTLDSSSQIAETELGELSQSDVESHNNKIDDKCDLATNSTFYDKRVDLYANCKSDAFGASINLGDKTLEAQSRGRADETIMSSVSSVWGDDRDVAGNSSNDNWEVPSSQILEQLSNTDNKGSHRSEVQLSLGYKAFMLAIQNQISVLSKILETKIQHQKIIEYQQAVSASLNKISSTAPSRSRKTSSNQDGSSQCGSIKDKKNLNVHSNHNVNDKLNDINLNSSNIKENTDNEITDETVIPESTGCVIS